MLFDAQRCVQNGEFRFTGRLRSTTPILRSQRPNMFWMLTCGYAALGILALGAASSLL
jgi:hypothetical protein